MFDYIKIRFNSSTTDLTINGYDDENGYGSTADVDGDLLYEFNVNEVITLTQQEVPSGWYGVEGLGVFIVPGDGVSITNVEVFLGGELVVDDWHVEFVERVDGVWWGKITHNDFDHDYDVDDIFEINIATVGGGGGDVVSPVNQLYVADTEKLIEFMDVEALLPPEVGGSSTSYTDFIINLLKIPFKIDDALQTEPKRIYLGSIDTDVLAPRLISDLIAVDLGVISVGSLYGNSLDYINGVTCDLILPFVENVISLEPSEIIGKEISVQYVLDGYTGDLTVNVGLVGELPLRSVKTSIGRVIPFKVGGDLSKDITSTRGVNNGVLSPYVRVRNPDFTNGDFDNLVLVSRELGESVGYVEVVEIDLRVKAKLGELEEIKTILKQGVIINE